MQKDPADMNDTEYQAWCDEMDARNAADHGDRMAEAMQAYGELHDTDDDGI